MNGLNKLSVPIANSEERDLLEAFQRSCADELTAIKEFSNIKRTCLMMLRERTQQEENIRQLGIERVKCCLALKAYRDNQHGC